MLVQHIKKGGKGKILKLLFDYRNSLCQETGKNDGSIPLLFGIEISSGLPDKVIKAIVSNSDHIKTIQDIIHLGVMYEPQAHNIYNILKNN